MSMESGNFYWAEDRGLDFKTPERARAYSRSPSRSPNPATDQADGLKTQKDKGLPLLRYNDWEEDRQTRAKLISENKRASLVLAPRKFWKNCLQIHWDPRMWSQEILTDQNINWEAIDTHLEGLGGLFAGGNKITLLKELFYKQVIDESTAAKEAKKKKSRTEEQRAQLDVVKGLWDVSTNIIVVEGNIAN
ncbi:hypothetical protein GGI35DRAFT_484431 [Trichoderma velutinum]